MTPVLKDELGKGPSDAAVKHVLLSLLKALESSPNDGKKAKRNNWNELKRPRKWTRAHGT